MPLLDEILGSGASGLGDLFAKAVGAFKLPPEVAAQIQAQISQNQFELNKIQLQNDAAIAADQSANIQAEARSNAYTAAARPTFMYTVEAILIWNYIIAPIAGRTPVTLPDNILYLFGVCVCGYVGARTYEKVQGATK